MWRSSSTSSQFIGHLSGQLFWELPLKNHPNHGSLLFARVFSHHVPLSVIIVEEPEPQAEMSGWLRGTRNTAANRVLAFLFHFFLICVSFPLCVCPYFSPPFFLSIRPSTYSTIQSTNVPMYLCICISIYERVDGWVDHKIHPSTDAPSSIHPFIDVSIYPWIYVFMRCMHGCICVYVYLYPCVCLSVYLPGPTPCVCLFVFVWFCMCASVNPMHDDCIWYM